MGAVYSACGNGVSRISSGGGSRSLSPLLSFPFLPFSFPPTPFLLFPGGLGQSTQWLWVRVLHAENFRNLIRDLVHSAMVHFGDKSLALHFPLSLTVLSALRGVASYPFKCASVSGLSPLNMGYLLGEGLRMLPYFSTFWKLLACAKMHQNIPFYIDKKIKLLQTFLTHSAPIVLHSSCLWHWALSPQLLNPGAARGWSWLVVAVN